MLPSPTTNIDMSRVATVDGDGDALRLRREFVG
jgi:hypothetical protein